MIYYQRGGKNESIGSSDLKKGLFDALDQLEHREKVLIIPPDITRIHSRAGDLTFYAWQYYHDQVTDIIPALGTHRFMSQDEVSQMFKHTPADLFRIHDFRNEIDKIGEVPREFVQKVSRNRLNEPIPVEINRLINRGKHDLILSIGQVVPHEVAGMANFNKNIFVGTGGAQMINQSHFLGAISGMEKIMGRPDNPVRDIFNFAEQHFLADLPIIYVLTVLGLDASGEMVIRGLMIGDDRECFTAAARLSQEVNINLVKEPLTKAVVYLDPKEFRSTWLGNKSIYRTRMAMADHGELIILAPGVKEFGEDIEIDRLIRKYGYCGTEKILELKEQNEDLNRNLSAAAHLIHGSTEGRFQVTYCPGQLNREEIQAVGYQFGKLEEMERLYQPEKKKNGYYRLSNAEEYYFINNPGLGLWACQDRFDR